MKDPIQVQVVDSRGRIASAQFPADMARGLQLQEGQVLDCRVQNDASLLLQRRPASADPPPAGKKGGP